jgi:MFS family permease
LLSNLLPLLPKVKAWGPVKDLQGARANLLAAYVVVGLLFLLLALSDSLRWVGVLASLPPLMVLYQYVYNWLQRPQEVRSPSVDDVRAGRRIEGPDERKVIEEGLAQAQETIDRNYDMRTLFIRFGLPALVLLVECMTVALALVKPKIFFSLEGDTATIILRGARYGAVGAYAFVLLDLGRRSFRHDITGGSALWAAVAIALGPLLAGTVALLFRLEPAKEDPWQSGIVLFFTGFAPRRVVAAIEQAALQLLRGSAPATTVTRSHALSTIRGITPSIEARLEEEGIYNVETLASAEPIRLLQSTSFDLRQILSWIDEALLITYVPRGWESLEEHGITGAIDLADLGDVAGASGGSLIDEIANRIGTTKSLFQALVDRIFADHQVRHIWTLYNRFTKDGRPRSATQQDGRPRSETQQ